MTDHPAPSAPDYGRSLQGIGVNLIVTNIARAITFATEVLGAELRFKTELFAAMRLSGQDFMFHADQTYRGTPLQGILADAQARGIGVELRAYEVDPDAAESRARALGFTVLGASVYKPHGLRECMILDDDGYLWIPSRRLPVTAS
jgi:catechol 2,3-dioxygenase-like lactoylglutathione lyase family enzyme